jgi:hypothetical protein
MRGPLLNPPGDSQTAEAAALADDAGVSDCAYGRDSVGRKLPLLPGEVVYEVGAGAVVLADIVVVDGFLTETAVIDRCVDCRCRGIGEAEEWLPVDLAHKLAIDFYARVGTDHLQVEG